MGLLVDEDNGVHQDRLRRFHTLARPVSGPAAPRPLQRPATSTSSAATNVLLCLITLIFAVCLCPDRSNHYTRIESY